MSVPESDLPPIAYQEATLSAALNSTLLGSFLIGIYTMVYFGTLYIYYSRKVSQSRIVISAITLLFALTIGQLGLQWYFVKWIFINNGASRETSYISTSYPTVPWWFILATEICTYLATVLADALLIWRCFHIWDRSLRAISPSLFLLFAQIGTYLYTIILLWIKQGNLTFEDGKLSAQVTSAGIFASFACTMATTCLIAYKIYPIFNQNLGHARGRFKQILDVLVQCAAVYALTSLLQAISFVITPLQSNDSAVVDSLEDYSSTLFAVTSGLVPTLLVARIAFASDEAEISTTPRLSVLQFQGQSAHRTTHSSMNNITVPRVGKGDGDGVQQAEKGTPEIDTNFV